MGSDFTWNGSIEAHQGQEAAVRMFLELFDPARFWPRVSESHPFNLFGIAPYLSPELESKLHSRGQLVFDRNDAGRLVSVVDSSRTAKGVFPDPGTRCATLVPGGYLRLLSDAQSDSFALFLELLRIRFCPSLRAFDDFEKIPRVRKWLTGSNRVPRASDPDVSARSLAIEMVEELRPPALDEDDIDEDPALDRIMRFDFLAAVPVKGLIWGAPKDEASCVRHVLELLAILCDDNGIEIDPNENELESLIKLNPALKRVWEEKLFESLVWLHIPDETSLPVDHLTRGGQKRTHVPMTELRAMLSRRASSPSRHSP